MDDATSAMNPFSALMVPPVALLEETKAALVAMVEAARELRAAVHQPIV